MMKILELWNSEYYIQIFELVS